MTWKHVLIIVAALAAPLICGLSPTCESSLATIDALSKVAIGGAMGNAMLTRRLRKKKPAKEMS